MKGIRKMANTLEKKGRKGDKLLAHVTPGEIIIPRSFAEDDYFRSVLATLFDKAGTKLEKFMVGRKENSVNPETGYLEFGWFKKAFGFSSKKFLGPLYGAERLLKPPEMPSIPAVQAEQAKRTAEPVEQASEQAKINRRLAASFLTRGFSKPKLGYGGLLGSVGTLG